MVFVCVVCDCVCCVCVRVCELVWCGRGVFFLFMWCAVMCKLFGCLFCVCVCGLCI